MSAQVREHEGETPEPFWGDCAMHFPHGTCTFGSGFMWVKLNSGEFVSQSEFFRRKDVCCWFGLNEKRAAGEASK